MGITESFGAPDTWTQLETCSTCAQLALDRPRVRKISCEPEALRSEPPWDEDGNWTDEDEPIVTNSLGGRQHKVTQRVDLLDPTALLLMAEVMAEGAVTYGEENWRLISRNDHLNRALVHLLKYQVAENIYDEDDLIHAACRVVMALAVER